MSIKCEKHDVKPCKVGKQNLTVKGVVFKPFMIQGECPKCREEELVEFLLMFEEQDVIELEEGSLKINWGKYCELNEEDRRIAAYFLLDADILTHESKGTFLVAYSGKSVDQGIHTGAPVYFNKEEHALGFKTAQYPGDDKAEVIPQ
jgi:hypothetical protein